MKRTVLLSIFSLMVFSSNAQDCCAGFEANFTYGAAFTTNGIEFENLSSGQWDFIVWNFGDGSSSNSEEPDHVYDEPGIYQVCVVIESNAGCRSELCYEVAVETTPDPCNDFLADYTWHLNPSHPLGVQFDNISPLPSDFYIWHFGDGSTSTDQEPYHEYEEGGMYQVCLVIETNDDCRSEYCREVCVEDPEPEPPTAGNCCDGFEANFNYFPTQTENRIEFQNLSVGDWDEIIWHFGDGTSSTQTSPDHIYPHHGIYQVCVVIENNDGCRSELCYEVAVETEPDPCNDFLADFVWHENIDSLGIQFENNCPISPDDYIWHFGDGSTSTDPDPYHEYEHPGVYQVCLVVENNDDCRSEYCRSVCVEDFNPCADFEVEFTWSESQSSGLLIEFDGVYSGQIDDIIWHFGDGSSSNDEHPNHHYDEPGMYQVCLVIENSEDCRSEYCITIAVEQQTDPCEDFEADFTWVVDFDNAGVHFEDLSTGNPSSYTWYFGDDTFSHLEEPTHYYTYTGLYQVCLVIENGDGCVAERCLPVYVPSYYFYLISPLGVNEIETSDLMVYPNPVSNVLRFTKPLTGNLEVLDAQGRSILVDQMQGSSALDLTGLSSGLYILRISEGNETHAVRVIKN